MKNRSVLITGFAVVVMAGLLAMGCKPREEVKTSEETDKPGLAEQVSEPDDQKPVGEDTPVVKPEAKPAVAGPAVISAEKYWDIHLERMELLKKFLAKRLDIYKESKDDLAAAEAKVRELTREQQQEMQELWAKHGTSPRDYFPRGEDRTEVKTERNQYLTDHPEIRDKMMALSKEIQEIRSEINKIQGIERPVRGQGGAQPESPVPAPESP